MGLDEDGNTTPEEEVKKLQAAKQHFHDFFVRLSRSKNFRSEDRPHYLLAMTMERNGEVKPLREDTLNRGRIVPGSVFTITTSGGKR
jgi:hypothetical protein